MSPSQILHGLMRDRARLLEAYAETDKKDDLFFAPRHIFEQKYGRGDHDDKKNPPKNKPEVLEN